MSDEIEIRGPREGVNLLARWLRGDDMKSAPARTDVLQTVRATASVRRRRCTGADIRDYARRCPTTTTETEAAFVAYKTLLLVELTADEQADWDTQRQEGERD